MGLGGLSQRSHRSQPIIHYNPPPQHSWPDRGNAEAFYEFFAYVWQICIFCVYVWQIAFLRHPYQEYRHLGGLLSTVHISAQSIGFAKPF